MIVDDFDIETQPIVDLECFYGKPKHIVDKCLILFSKVIHDQLLESRDCSILGEIGACNGNIPIYCFTLEGEKIAFYLSGIGSAVASETCYDVHWQTGAPRFIMFGSCGSLDRESTRGRYIIPTESYRGEGSSYYYAAPADYISIRNADRLSAIFDEIGAPYVKGRVWTTDSMLRETVGLVQKRRREGCLAVEMESFALFHNANILGKNAACLLTISDSFVYPEKTTAEERQNSFTQMMKVALEAG